MADGTRVICVDTGRRCDFRPDVGCSHVVHIFRQNGNWESLGLKTRSDILALYRDLGLDIPPHFSGEIGGQ